MAQGTVAANEYRCPLPSCVLDPHLFRNSESLLLVSFKLNKPTMYRLPLIALRPKCKKVWSMPTKPSKEDHFGRDFTRFVAIPKYPGALNL